jgi:hypothetical protein
MNMMMFELVDEGSWQKRWDNSDKKDEGPGLVDEKQGQTLDLVDNNRARPWSINTYLPDSSVSRKN